MPRDNCHNIQPGCRRQSRRLQNHHSRGREVSEKRGGNCNLKEKAVCWVWGPSSLARVPRSQAGSSPPPAISIFYTSHQCHHSWHLIMHQRWKWTGTEHPNFSFSYYFCGAPWSWELIKSCGTDNQCRFCWVKLHYMQIQKKREREKEKIIPRLFPG